MTFLSFDITFVLWVWDFQSSKESKNLQKKFECCKIGSAKLQKWMKSDAATNMKVNETSLSVSCGPHTFVLLLEAWYLMGGNLKDVCATFLTLS